MPEFIYITAAYSNAVLLAILTNVSDFAKKLELPIPQPITVTQVQSFKLVPVKRISGALTLTNGDRFFYQHGDVFTYYGYKNYLMPPQDMDWPTTLEQWPTNFFGPMNMTTNEVIEFARDALRKLGYDPQRLHADGTPERFIGPSVSSRYGKLIPFCEVEWRHATANDVVTVVVNAEKKQIVQFSLVTTNYWRPDPKIDVVPVPVPENQKRSFMKMILRPNAPRTWPTNSTRQPPNGATNSPKLTNPDRKKPPQPDWE
ncbi:MAG: hypothetical protein HZA90_02380 [Verrucomicrobia bacterium]|nr:hypothetical protein [Verrucomicrobiota bacterium]